MKTKINQLIKYSALASSALVATSVAYASADYGPAIWNPPCNANYYTSGYGHKFHVCHDMEGYYQATVSYFKGCGFTSASVHYLTNGKTDYSGDAAPGEITQMVSEVNYAWHALCWNQHSTGTEHEGFANNPAWYTEEQYVASAGISAHEASKFGYAKDRNHIVAHGQKSVPGWSAWAGPNLGIDPNCNTHTDPGPYWDWNHYMALVNGSTPLVWSAWQNISVGSTFTSGFGSCSQGANLLDVFGKGTDNQIWHSYWDGASWSAWQTTGGGGVLNSAPAAISWGYGREDIFARGTDNACWHQYWATGMSSWSAWENISVGSTFTSGFASCSRGANLLDVFGKGGDNQIWVSSWNGASWSAWQPTGGSASFNSGPGVAVMNSDIHLFARGFDNACWHQYWHSGVGWSAWQNISVGSTFTSGFAACSRGVNRLDVFGKGGDNQIWFSSWNGASWSAWQPTGGVASFNSDPSVVADGSNVHLFGRGTDNVCWHQWGH
ncbi:MAG: N-acetylmuramoyl-L-alanine amidase [Verrucomicrobiota bacterium]|nr:N-acetylmuramoyl-L-alanine amidase [Verrucomicrobiota bacterium]